MIRRFLNKTTLMFVLALLSGAGLLMISQYVQQAQHKLASLEYQKAQAQEDIHILEAEWQYLNAPQRLEMLVAEHLGVEQPGFAPQLPESLSPVFTGASALPSPLSPETDPSGSHSSPYFQNISIQTQHAERGGE